MVALMEEDNNGIKDQEDDAYKVVDMGYNASYEDQMKLAVVRSRRMSNGSSTNKLADKIAMFAASGGDLPRRASLSSSTTPSGGNGDLPRRASLSSSVSTGVGQPQTRRSSLPSASALSRTEVQPPPPAAVTSGEGNVQQQQPQPSRRASLSSAKAVPQEEPQQPPRRASLSSVSDNKERATTSTADTDAVSSSSSSLADRMAVFGGGGGGGATRSKLKAVATAATIGRRYNTTTTKQPTDMTLEHEPKKDQVSVATDVPEPEQPDPDLIEAACKVVDQGYNASYEDQIKMAMLRNSPKRPVGSSSALADRIAKFGTATTPKSKLKTVVLAATACRRSGGTGASLNSNVSIATNASTEMAKDKDDATVSKQHQVDESAINNDNGKSDNTTTNETKGDSRSILINNDTSPKRDTAAADGGWAMLREQMIQAMATAKLGNSDDDDDDETAIGDDDDSSTFETSDSSSNGPDDAVMDNPTTTGMTMSSVPASNGTTDESEASLDHDFLLHETTLPQQKELPPKSPQLRGSRRPGNRKTTTENKFHDSTDNMRDGCCFLASFEEQRELSRVRGTPARKKSKSLDDVGSIADRRRAFLQG